jgi:hypothetical protein
VGGRLEVRQGVGMENGAVFTGNFIASKEGYPLKLDGNYHTGVKIKVSTGCPSTARLARLCPVTTESLDISRPPPASTCRFRPSPSVRVPLRRLRLLWLPLLLPLLLLLSLHALLLLTGCCCLHACVCAPALALVPADTAALAALR